MRFKFTEERDAARKALNESEAHFQERADQLKAKRQTELDALFVKGLGHERDMVDLAYLEFKDKAVSLNEDQWKAWKASKIPTCAPAWPVFLDDVGSSQ